MAQENQKSTKSNSKEVFKKMHNATIGRIFYRPHQPQASAQTTKTPPEPSRTLTGPAHVVHHPSQTKTVPIEFGHPNNNNNVTIFSPNLHSNDPSQEVDAPCGHVGNIDGGTKLEHTKTNEMFSNYIVKVKDKMRTTSNVGAVRRSATRRDSFNDKVSSYINRAKLKIMKSTSVGDDDNMGDSFK